MTIPVLLAIVFGSLCSAAGGAMVCRGMSHQMLPARREATPSEQAGIVLMASRWQSLSEAGRFQALETLMTSAYTRSRSHGEQLMSDLGWAADLIEHSDRS